MGTTGQESSFEYRLAAVAAREQLVQRSWTSRVGPGFRARRRGWGRPPSAILALEKENRRRPLLGIRQRIEAGRKFLLLRVCQRGRLEPRLGARRSGTSRSRIRRRPEWRWRRSRGVRSPRGRRDRSRWRGSFWPSAARPMRRTGCGSDSRRTGNCRPDIAVRAGISCPHDSRNIARPPGQRRRSRARVSSGVEACEMANSPDGEWLTAAAAAGARPDRLQSACRRSTPSTVSIVRAPQYDQRLYGTMRQILAAHAVNVRGQARRAEAESGGVRAGEHASTRIRCWCTPLYEAFRALGAASVRIAEGPGPPPQHAGHGRCGRLFPDRAAVRGRLHRPESGRRHAGPSRSASSRASANCICRTPCWAPTCWSRCRK